MDFFKKTWVSIVGWVLLVVSIVILALAGYTQEEMSGVLVAVMASIAAAGAVIVLIKKLIDKYKE